MSTAEEEASSHYYTELTLKIVFNKSFLRASISLCKNKEAGSMLFLYTRFFWDAQKFWICLTFYCMSGDQHRSQRLLLQCTGLFAAR